MPCAKSSRSLSRCARMTSRIWMRRLVSSVTSRSASWPATDDVAVAQLDDVAVGVDVGDEQALVRLDAAGDVVQVGAHVEALDLPLDRAALGLHLDLDPGARLGALGDLDRVEVQVGCRARPGPSR